MRTADDARVLAERLLAGVRWPVAVVSISSTASEPYIDADALKEEVCDLAEVVVMPTSEVSWAFSSAMPEMTQVYGGAGRVYSVDGRWQTDPYKSPLRFAYARSDSTRVVADLARDVAAFALQAGLIRSASDGREADLRSGSVRGLVGDSRALVTLDDGTYATIWAELTSPDVDIARIARQGQPVRGVLDTESRRFDVRSSLRSVADAVAMYRPGTNVLARVESVSTNSIALSPFPGLTAHVARGHITDNPLDRIEDLFTPGEVVVATVVAVGASPGEGHAIALRLDLVDDEAAVELPLALLEGGPPWLALPQPPPAPVPAPTSPVVEAPVDTPLSLPEPIRPDRPAGVSPLPGPATLGRSPGLAAGQLQELHDLRRNNQRLEAELNLVIRDRDTLRTNLRNAGSKRRKAERAARNTSSEQGLDVAGQFSDPADQFKFEVYLEWARRIPASQKSERPLRPYTLAPTFLPSLDETQGVERSKVVAVAVEVLTGLAAELDSRELHPLRVAESGSSPAVRRDDGAVCMRVALQRNAPAARRMHFWQLGDQVEFSRVVQHDDLTR